MRGRGDGLLHVFVPHATAGHRDPRDRAGSDDDLLAALADLLPADDRWRHRHGSRGHGRSHVMPALVPPYATVPVLGGRLALGTWQSICLVDLNVDNPVREVRRLSLPARLTHRGSRRLSPSSRRARSRWNSTDEQQVVDVHPLVGVVVAARPGPRPAWCGTG